MIITPTQVHIIEVRRRNLLAASDQARLIAVTNPSPSAAPQTVGRIRAGLSQAVASLVALASIG